MLRLAARTSRVEVFAADGARRGLELARVHQPDVIVLDLEAEARMKKTFNTILREAAADNASATVVLGEARYISRCRPERNRQALSPTPVDS